MKAGMLAPKCALTSALACALTACMASPPRRASAQDGAPLPDPDAGYASEFHGRPGVVVGAHLLGTHLGGDLDGESVLSGPDTIFLSDPDDALGYELVLGYRGRGMGWELAYERSEHEGEFAGFPGDVEYKAFTLRGLQFWRANAALQPQAFVGLLIPLADIEDGSSDGVVDGNAKLRSGFGVELGGGLSWWITRRLVLDLRVSYVYQEFSSAEGVADDEEDIDDGVEAPSFGLGLGLTWVIGRTD